MHDYHPLIVRAVSKLESNTSDSRRALFQQARIILIDQLRIRQPTASDSEIMRERAALEDAIRKVESELGTPALPQTTSARAARAKCADGSTPNIFAQRTELANGPPSGPRTFPEGYDPPNELMEAADASVLCNLLGIQLLDQLMLDAADPLAPDSLRQNAWTVLKWLSIGKPEELKAKHYDQFARAVQVCIMEAQTPSGGLVPATAQPPLVLHEDMRGALNGLLEREQTAEFFDKALTWFANVWIRLIVALNVVGIIGLLIAAPTLWAGIDELPKTYSPINVWLWITELVALSPALGAVVWRDRRHFGHGAIAYLARDLTAAVTRVLRGGR
ncbi:MAG: hypothetical protein WBD95_20710 [Xanthobacteraceae bacterium]